jgi:hypothetical protein
MAIRPIACLCALAAGLAACGAARDERAAAPLPPSGRAYRALSGDERLAVARACRDRAAARAAGVAARQLDAVDADALRERIDEAYRIIVRQRRPVAEVCADVIAFVTPGLRVSIAGANDGGDGTWSVETRSDLPLTIRGRVTPERGGRVVARREAGGTTAGSAPIGADGRFVLGPIRLRKLADNSFTLTLAAPPNAPRKVLFSAICLDCLAGATVDSAS